mgnify:CR=1 FL=1
MDQKPQLTSEEIARFEKYGGVLMFMHWAMNQPEGKTKPLGELLITGCRLCNLPHPPDDIEAGLLSVAFRLAGQGVPFTTVMA